MIVSALVSQLWCWHERLGVAVVGEVPSGLPAPTLPNLALVPDCLGDALAITVVNLAIHVSMAKMFAARLHYHVDEGQEVSLVDFYLKNGLKRILKEVFYLFFI
jgi:MFS superfamily sulfate permease-like transporter